MVTAGPGVTNTVTGIANASLASNSNIVIGGCTTRPQANMGPLQDIPTWKYLNLLPDIQELPEFLNRL